MPGESDSSAPVYGDEIEGDFLRLLRLRGTHCNHLFDNLLNQTDYMRRGSLVRPFVGKDVPPTIDRLIARLSWAGP